MKLKKSFEIVAVFSVFLCVSFAQGQPSPKQKEIFEQTSRYDGQVGQVVAIGGELVGGVATTLVSAAGLANAPEELRDFARIIAEREQAAKDVAAFGDNISRENFKAFTEANKKLESVSAELTEVVNVHFKTAANVEELVKEVNNGAKERPLEEETIGKIRELMGKGKSKLKYLTFGGLVVVADASYRIYVGFSNYKPGGFFPWVEQLKT